MRRFICILAIIAGFLILFSCKTPTSSNGSSGYKTIAVSQFCLKSGDISGWTPAACGSYNQDELYGLIDGDAHFHETHGMVNGIVQNLTNADGLGIEAYVSDFGKADSAKSMFEAKKATAIQILSLKAYDSAVAIIEIQGAYYKLFAHLGQYYFELTLKNFDTDSQGIDGAETFLNYYKSLLL